MHEVIAFHCLFDSSKGHVRKDDIGERGLTTVTTALTGRETVNHRCEMKIPGGIHPSTYLHCCMLGYLSALSSRQRFSDSA